MKALLHAIQALATAIGGPGVFIIAFLDSSFLSFPEVPDGLVVSTVLAHPHWMVYYAGLATIGSVLGCLEIVYMGCFLLVPGGFAILAFTGHASLANRYWTIVTAAEFGAFAGLAFIQTRPPWVIERKPVLTDPSIHWLASQMVQNLTTRANTFPSGHAAGSLAVGLAVVGAVPWAGAVLLLIAAGICLGSVIGRYHYVMDVVAGTALALAVWLAY